MLVEPWNPVEMDHVIVATNLPNKAKAVIAVRVDPDPVFAQCIGEKPSVRVGSS